MEQDEARRAKVLAAKKKASSQDANRHSTHAGEGGKSLNTVSPDVRMASELFSDSAASSAFAEFAPNQNEEIKRLTERVRDLETKERVYEASLRDLSSEYQMASQELQKFDPVLIASAQNQLEDARQTVSQLREQLSQEEQKMESMEYEISGLRQKLTHQEEKSSKLKEALQKSEEERKEYGDLLILANKRADELEETEKQHQQKVEQYENANLVAESNLQEARSDIQKRDKMILELQQSAENYTNELNTYKRESSSATKQLKALSEKTEKLGKENRILIERLDEMRQTSIRLETENSAIRERIQTANEGIESERSDLLADLTAAKQRLSEAESSMEVCRFELEQEKQHTKALTEQLNSANTNINVTHPQTDLEKPLRTLQLQLDVERQKSREVLDQLETVRNDMAELRRRYMFILEENKQLNEIVEAEVFESDEFCAGMKEYEVNGNDNFTPDSAPSPERYASYEHERRHIIKRARASLLQLHEKTIRAPLSRGRDPPNSGLGSERSSSSFDIYRPFTSSSLPPRIKPRHQPFMDVPKCSGCLGRAVEV
ncbi:unnamed protein product [Umbelopsis vinacea]